MKDGKVQRRRACIPVCRMQPAPRTKTSDLTVPVDDFAQGLFAQSGWHNIPLYGRSGTELAAASLRAVVASVLGMRNLMII